MKISALARLGVIALMGFPLAAGPALAVTDTSTKTSTVTAAEQTALATQHNAVVGACKSGDAAKCTAAMNAYIAFVKTEIAAGRLDAATAGTDVASVGESVAGVAKDAAGALVVSAALASLSAAVSTGGDLSGTLDSTQVAALGSIATKVGGGSTLTNTDTGALGSPT